MEENSTMLEKRLYIPPELFRGIADNLVDDHSALYSLSMTSKLWNQESHHLLYHTVTHNPGGHNSHGAPLSAFLENPHLSGYIHTYRLQEGDTHDIPDGWWDLLRPGPARRAMKNLKQLYIEAQYNSEVPNIFDGCPFQLLSFSWDGFLSRPTLGRFFRFLETQEDLRYLRPILRQQVFDIPLPLSGCTKLQHLEGNQELIEAFLPGRNISSLVWFPNRDGRPTSVQRMSREVRSIEKLSLQTRIGRFSFPPFNDLIQILKNVQYLELTADLFETVFKESGPLENMYKLPCLRGLILQNYLNLGTWDVDSDKRAKLFGQCPLLEFLDIELEYDCERMDVFEIEEMDPRKFVRYSRDGDVKEYDRPRRQRNFNSF